MFASEVMNRAASLLNDTTKQTYTYAVQVPYLNMALDELQESLEEHSIAITKAVSTVLNLAAGDTVLTGLPTELVEIQGIYERTTGTTGWSPLKKSEFLPVGLSPVSYLQEYTYQGQNIVFLAATQNKEIMIQYVGKTQDTIVDENSEITIINSKSVLTYRTAGLCAEFIGENPSRAQSLNGFAQMALDKMMGINVKGNQDLSVRRRPFMAGYRSRR